MALAQFSDALPGGGRIDCWGFSGLGYYANFWLSSEGESSGAWYWSLNYINDGVYRNNVM